MSKVKSLKNGWVELPDSGEAINLNSFKSFRKGVFGMGEDPDGNDHYYIEVTEFNKDDQGQDNKYIIITYGETEGDMCDQDYQKMLDALK